MTLDPERAFWRYAPGGALSHDGTWQVTGRDRYSYLVRCRGEITIVECEHFERQGRGGVEFQLAQPLAFTGSAGTRPATADEARAVRQVLQAALPLLDRPIVVFADP